MITLFRMIRVWQLKTKCELAIWQFIDKQTKAIINNPEELEKKFVEAFAKIIHEANQTK